MRKFNRDVIDEIMVELNAEELSMADIAKEFDISIPHLYNINDGKSWKIPNFSYPVRRCDGTMKSKGDSDMDMPRELKAIIGDIEQVHSQLSAVLRDLDMIMGTYEDPTNVDVDPPDEDDWGGLEEGREYNIYEDVKGHVFDTTTDDGG